MEMNDVPQKESYWVSALTFAASAWIVLMLLILFAMFLFHAFTKSILFPVHYHTLKVMTENDNILVEFQWLRNDGGPCGTARKFSNEKVWEALAYEDMSFIHYFQTAKEADTFVGKWCKP